VEGREPRPRDKNDVMASLSRGYMWNKTPKLFQNYFKIILFHT